MPDLIDRLPFLVASIVRPALLSADDNAIRRAIAEVQTCRDDFAGVAESTLRLVERYDTDEGRVGREDVIDAFRRSARECETVAAAAEAVLESLNARRLP